MDICNVTKLPCAYCNPACEHRINNNYKRPMNEGFIQKGGKNKPPSTDRPKGTPVGQGKKNTSKD